MLSRMQKGTIATWLMVMLLLALGCGKGGRGDKMIVKGTVTIDGKPGAGVTLSFYGPTDKAASGVVVTQADGTYEVMFNTAAGEGNYKITANQINTKPGMATSEGIDEYQLKLGSGAAPNALPAKYNDVATSGLSAPLQKGLNEGKNFALTRK